jgi:3-methyladenine DNA glycosylase AlkD
MGEADTLAAQISRRLRARPSASVPELRRLRREISRDLRDAPARVVIRAAKEVSRMAHRGHRFVAYELVKHHPAAPSALDAKQLGRLGEGMDSWDAVDCFAIYLSGPAWQQGRIPARVIHAWARSPDVWWRRAALVSTVPLNSRAHGGKGDTRQTLAVCRMLERDRDPMVVKALSWALRELSKRDPRAVGDFIAARAGSLAALVKREVRNKLSTGLKNPGRRPKRARG